MKAIFNIEYYTAPGQYLQINIAGKEVRMNCRDGHTWMADMDIKCMTGDVLDYHYCVMDQDGEARREWTVVSHHLAVVNADKTYRVYNRWIDVPEDSYLYSSAFTQCVNRRDHELPTRTGLSKVVRLKVRAPQLRQGDTLLLAGAGDTFGNWNTRQALPMMEQDNNVWAISIDGAAVENTLMEFKFVILHDGESPTYIWEEGFNRTLQLPAIADGEVIVQGLSQAVFPLPGIKCAGTAIPVFSLRSEGSFGVGDFGDLVKMIDWVALTGQRALQILPINDTTMTYRWTDSYPYSCISIFALHPQYADLRQLPRIKDRKKQAEFDALQKELNALPQIDYERMISAKMEYLRLCYEQEGTEVLASAAYKLFHEEEKAWLDSYAQYCCLRDKYGTADYTQWKTQSVRSRKDTGFWCYVQFILSRQMHAAHEYARSKGVILKGDIPIGVNRHGCDAWQEPRYFNLNGQAGAPPDDFSVNGQNWGFPTYNWDEMIKDGCEWWIRRFSNMSKYFDAYRIDHVLGFFRIWEIPVHSVHGLLGQFSPALPMTVSEIEQYGLKWNEELYTTPFIMDWVLDRVFGDKAGYVRENFVEPKDDDGHYRMRQEFDTQRKVEAWYASASGSLFEASFSTEELEQLRDGLYTLISNVLFLNDHRNPEVYHPRISAQMDTMYESLWETEKQAFNNLYNDYFYRRNNDYWYHEAMRKLPLLVEATRMLVCAEDLGMVPDCVPWVMDELKILSLEIQSMPKEPGSRFGHLSRNPYRSVCTISSHDTATLRMWWDEDMERTQAYYSTMLHRGNIAPHPLPGWLARDIVGRHLMSPSMLCIITLQDWLATDEKIRLADAGAERINIPANPKHYWRWRMHLTLEDLLAASDFNASLRQLIRETLR